MNFLLDTNVVSEWTKPRPNPGVVAWLDQVDEDRVFLSVVTIAELRYGIDRLPAGKRRERLHEWLQQELPSRFENRILAIDTAVANACGIIVARREALRQRVQAMDALIAATAEVHHLSLVTRNDSDFRGVVRSVLNPWT